MDLYPHNPFHYAKSLGMTDLFGRTEEICQIESTIRNRGRLFLAGPRRFGKTAILRTAQKNLSQENAFVLYVNAETCLGIRGLVRKVVGSVAEIVSRIPNNIGPREIRICFSHLNPIFRRLSNGQEIFEDIEIDCPSDSNRQIKVLVDTLDSLERFAYLLHPSKSVGLILDEFSVIAGSGVTAETQISEAIQRHKWMGYVFADSNIQFMRDITTKHDSGFHQVGLHLEIYSIPKADFSAWLQMQFYKNGIKVTEDEPVLRILSLAEEIPFNVYLLAHNCWEELRRGSQLQSRKLTVASVEYVYRQTVKHLDVYFTHIWNTCSPTEQRILLALLYGENDWPKVLVSACSNGLNVASVHSGLQTLKNKHILWDDVSLAEKTVRFEDPFFAYWVKMMVSV